MMATTKEELEVKNSIKALLTSSPCVSTISSLQKEYADLIGEPIPYKKLGYNGLEHLLKSIKDVCIVRGCGWYAEVYPVVTEDIAHINEMVTRQKVTPKNRKFAMPRRRFSTPVPVSNYSRSPFAYQNSPINTIPNSRSTVKENMVNNASGVCATNTATTTITTHGLTANTGATTPSSTPQGSNCQRNLSHINENPSRLIEFKTTLTRNSNLQVDQLKSNVEKDSGHAVQHSPQNSINRDDAQSSHMSFQAVKETFEEDISNVPQKVQDNLKTLIAQYPDGIWASDLPTAYMKLFKRVLFYKDYGYVNLVDMCIALKHIFHYIRPGLDDFKLFDKSKPFPESAEKYWTISSSGQAAKKPSHIEPLPDLDWSDFKDRLPSDIFPYGQIIPNQFLPKSTRVGDVFDAVVVEVYDPSKFWFYLGNSVNKTPLDDLMDQLQYFYNDSTNAQEYAVPRAVIKEGLYCVQIIIGEYHRAKVIRVLPQEDCVRLFFIDYGSISKVPMKGLCFLRSEFAALPAQGIRCRLANIAPVTKGITWCRTAVNTFRDMINRKDTKIKISYIDWQEEFVCVFLADVTELNNVHYVNEKLVKEGIAVWCEEKQLKPFSLPIFTSKVKNLHLFPTYSELEYGLAPNSNEMFYLQEMLVPLQFCMPQYFKPIPQVLKEFDYERKSFENSYYKSLKRNHRRFVALNVNKVELISKSRKIDLSIFGKLSGKIAEFTFQPEMLHEENASCKKSVDGLAIIRNKRRNFTCLQLCRDNKELSEKIIKLINITNKQDARLDLNGSPSVSSQSSSPNCSEHSSSSQNEENNFNSTVIDQSKTLDYFNGIQNYEDSLSLGSSDLNIFDNPNAFNSECSGSNHQTGSNSSSPLSPETFSSILHSKIENWKEISDDCNEDEATQTSDPSVAASWHLNNPFREYLMTPVEGQNCCATNSSSNQESSMKNTAASRSLSLASLVSSESDYKEFVPRSARICGDDSSPTALVQYKTQMPEIELCDRINQVEIAPIVDQAISLGESTEISSNETIDSCNYPLNASLNYLAQMLESASRTSRSQVQLAPPVLPHFGPLPNCSETCSIPQYPPWSNDVNYRPASAYPVNFGINTKPPPGYSPAHCSMMYPHQHIQPTVLPSHNIPPIHPNMPLFLGYRQHMHAAPISINNEHDFYAIYNQQFYNGN
uniref:Tudor domain-containing protein 5 n=1 Tax=Dendroctonus ponderosae TaxID=77166 RepID=A0AAR5PK98_DENPD